MDKKNEPVDVNVSSELMDLLTAWFPDCGGIIDIDDATDAMHGYGCLNKELQELLGRLSNEGVNAFSPFYVMNLLDYVEDLLCGLRALGFGGDPEEDIQVNGGDCVDYMNDAYEFLTIMVEREKKAQGYPMMPAFRTLDGYEFEIEPEALCEKALYSIWWEDLEVNPTEDLWFDTIFPHSLIDFSEPGMKELYDAALTLRKKYGEDCMSHWDELKCHLIGHGWGIYDSDSRTLFWSPYMGIKDWKEYCDEDEAALTQPKNKPYGWVKGEYVSVWNDGSEVRTPGRMHTRTGEVQSIAQVSSKDRGSLEEEYFEAHDGHVFAICTNCHEYILRDIMVEDNVGDGLHEDLECAGHCEEDEFE